LIDLGCVPDIGVTAVEPVHLGHILGTHDCDKQHTPGLVNGIIVPRHYRNGVVVRQHIWPACSITTVRATRPMML